MSFNASGAALLLALSVAAQVAQAEDHMPLIFEDFQSTPETRWGYVADGVMGGVSQGQAQMVHSDGFAAVRLSGQVSTDNNGGFIQVRRDIEPGAFADAQGLRITARGNGETYYVFLRTEGLARVWYSYRFSFVAPADWTTIDMDFADFNASHAEMPQSFDPAQLRRVGLVAYGRDHEADLTVRAISLY
ncbi:MAG: CIA30 family protein [Pseudomonadota bacterium]